ncbi:hypothetical protein ABZX88_34455 [Kitasatospora aureofaciens]|uniref:hypothetical protein n=1 Tax=Kitasatospora aureofaciens TaxID=1894 RepID=UPI0033B97DD1
MTSERTHVMAQKYAPVSITPTAKAALMKTKLTASADIGRQLTFSELIPAICAVADAHPEELLRLLAGAEEEGSTE